MTSTSWDGNSGGWGLLNKSALWGEGGMDIFWNHTILRYFPGGGGLCTSSPRSSGGGMKKVPLPQHPACSQVTGGRRILPYTGYNRYLPL